VLSTQTELREHGLAGTAELPELPLLPVLPALLLLPLLPALPALLLLPLLPALPALLLLPLLPPVALMRRSRACHSRLRCRRAERRFPPLRFRRLSRLRRFRL
jgi:hypothetical protein